MSLTLNHVSVNALEGIIRYRKKVSKIFYGIAQIHFTIIVIKKSRLMTICTNYLFKRSKHILDQHHN